MRLVNSYLLGCDLISAFPGSTPYVSLRLVMALMGALCSPMAYVTLKATGQSAPAALVAATLVAFGTSVSLAFSPPLWFFLQGSVLLTFLRGLFFLSGMK